MPRWEPDAADRLALAAVDLFAESGYDNATVIDIAVRAGLTKSTFFRYFQDKREVLFGDGSLHEQVVAAADRAPRDATALHVVQHALDVAGALVFTPDRRDFIVRRAAVIAASPELREREALKELSLIEALVDVLRRRGSDDAESRVTARLGSVAMRIAYEQWSATRDGEDFPVIFRHAMSQVRTATARWSSTRSDGG